MGVDHRLKSDVLPSEEKAVADVEPEPPHESDTGNAERFVAQHSANIRYCPQMGTWFVWDRVIWRPDETGEVMRLAKQTVKAMYAEASYLDGEKDRKARARHAINTEAERRLKAMVSLAQSDPHIIVTPDRLDQHPHLLATFNCLVDLRTGEPVKNSSDYYITHVTKAAFWPHDRECPTFIACLEQWTGGDHELLDFLQVAVGYTLTGGIGEEVLFFIYGPTRTGKTKFIRAIQGALGDLARSIDPDVLMRGRNRAGQADPDIAKLPGVRMAVTFETEEGCRLAEAKVKRYTGGDIISTRALYGHPFEFVPQFKLWLASNHRPEITGNQAIMERMIVIPFDNAIPYEERDRDLATKLDVERNGILAWAIEGARRYYQEGLHPPQVCLTAAREYKEEMDTVERWIGEWCETGPGLRAPFSDLWDDYELYVRDEQISGLTKGRFGTALKEKGHLPSEVRGTAGVKLREGIRLRSQSNIGGDTDD